MKNYNNGIVQFKNKFYLLNSELATAEQVEIYEDDIFETVYGNYFVYLVNKENKSGKCFCFNNIKDARTFYFDYTDCFGDNFMKYSNIELGLQFENNAFVILSSKNEDDNISENIIADLEKYREDVKFLNGKSLTWEINEGILTIYVDNTFLGHDPLDAYAYIFGELF